MTVKTESLRDLYLDVTQTGFVTERQQETPSHAPIEEPELEIEKAVSSFVKDDGLSDAVEGTET